MRPASGAEGRSDVPAATRKKFATTAPSIAREASDARRRGSPGVEVEVFASIEHSALLSTLDCAAADSLAWTHRGEVPAGARAGQHELTALILSLTPMRLWSMRRVLGNRAAGGQLHVAFAGSPPDVRQPDGLLGINAFIGGVPAISEAVTGRRVLLPSPSTPPVALLTLSLLGGGWNH